MQLHTPQPLSAASVTAPTHLLGAAAVGPSSTTAVAAPGELSNRRAATRRSAPPQINCQSCSRRPPRAHAAPLGRLSPDQRLGWLATDCG